VGASVGSRVLVMLGIYTAGGLVPTILVAILGAVIVVALVRLIKKG
jgi:Transglycosylase associated protein.